MVGDPTFSMVRSKDRDELYAGLHWGLILTRLVLVVSLHQVRPTVLHCTLRDQRVYANFLFLFEHTSHDLISKSVQHGKIMHSTRHSSSVSSLLYITKMKLPKEPRSFYFRQAGPSKLSMKFVHICTYDVLAYERTLYAYISGSCIHVHVQ